MHLPAPATDRVLFGQLEHAVDRAGLYVPALQRAHAAEELAPSEGENVPAAHCRHRSGVRSPVAVPYVPTGQGVQVPAPYEPGLHATRGHEALPASEVVPLAHALHALTELALDAFEKVPAGQGVHAPAPSFEKVPGEQTAHAVALPIPNVPAAHVWQTDEKPSTKNWPVPQQTATPLEGQRTVPPQPVMLHWNIIIETALVPV